MALDLADRLLTIAVTATLTSAAWIVVGTTIVDSVDQPSPAPASGRTAPGMTQSATASPNAIPAGTLTIPVLGVAASQLSDTFNEARGGGSRTHEALDIPAPEGTPVVAAAAGTIEKLFLSEEGGNTIYVRSADRRTIYYYAHLEAYEAGLREGQAVKPGQRLGTVGSTGNADPAAPHLHFAVMRTAPGAAWWERAEPMNPYPLMSGR